MNPASPQYLQPAPWRLCLAPMMQRTDRHFRYLVRLISPHIRLYTEMVTAAAIIHGDRERLLARAACERPVALQLGGGDPERLAMACRHATPFAYDEVNLNCGCPSDRVHAGAFGACLMREPERVARCIVAMRENLPAATVVSVKTRLGVDELYSYAYFSDFVGTLAAHGCRVFHIHARKAWLQGLSPRENREIPPLEYAWVHRLKREYPELSIVINGGLCDVAGALAQLEQVDGVMLGRHAYAAPYDLGAFDRALFPAADPTPARSAIIEDYLHYVDREWAAGTPLRALSRHLLNIFQGQPYARRWRRLLTEQALGAAATPAGVRRALAAMPHAPATAA